MLFHFLNFSQCVVCMFGHRKICEVTNLKVHSKGRYFVFKKSLFKNYNKRLVWTTKLFSCICDITKIDPYGNSNGWRVGRMLGWALHVSKSKPVLVFLYHCISDGNRLFSENFGCHFHFILHVMSDKAEFVRGALLCVQRYRGNLALYHSNSTSCWQRINLHIYIYIYAFSRCFYPKRLTVHSGYTFFYQYAYIYAVTNSVSLWDYGINKFNCITVSLQFML